MTVLRIITSTPTPSVRNSSLSSIQSPRTASAIASLKSAHCLRSPGMTALRSPGESTLFTPRPMPNYPLPSTPRTGRCIRSPSSSPQSKFPPESPRASIAATYESLYSAFDSRRSSMRRPTISEPLGATTQSPRAHAPARIESRSSSASRLRSTRRRPTIPLNLDVSTLHSDSLSPVLEVFRLSAIEDLRSPGVKSLLSSIQPPTYLPPSPPRVLKRVSTVKRRSVHAENQYLKAVNKLDSLLNNLILSKF
jgi:hypothetical protein